MLVQHLLVALFAVVSPIAGFVSYQRLLVRSRNGEEIDRLTLYRTTMLTQWLLFVACLLVWSLSGRSWQLVGVSVSLDLAFFVALALTIAIIAWLVSQLRAVQAADDDQFEKFRGHLGTVELIVPRNSVELASFRRVAVTAGIVEEFLWRGFLIWYLSLYVATWYAAILATVVFGLAHAYQGWDKVPQITLVGATFTVLYLMTGSLLLPVILHISVDVLQGRLAFELVSRNN